MIETSFQRTDPLGALAGRRLTLAAAASVVLIALFSTAWTVSTTWSAISSAGLFSAAAGVLAVAVVRSPLALSRGASSLVLVLGCFGYATAVLEPTAAGLHALDWAPYALAVLLVALVPYRPLGLMTIAVVLVAVWSAALAALSPHLDVDPPVGFLQVSVVAPILVLPLAGLAFTSYVLKFVVQWRRGALAATAEEALGQETDIIRAVQQTRVTILNEEVVPFFAELAAKGEISESDRIAARDLAESIRSIMVADIERSWLEDLVVRGVPTAESVPDLGSMVSDPSGAAQAMDLDQRSALRALLTELRSLAGPSGSTVHIELSQGARRCEVSLAAPVVGPRRQVRAALRPFLAVMATVFSDVSFQIRDNTFSVRFCYDRT